MKIPFDYVISEKATILSVCVCVCGGVGGGGWGWGDAEFIAKTYWKILFKDYIKVTEHVDYLIILSVFVNVDTPFRLGTK